MVQHLVIMRQTKNKSGLATICTNYLSTSIYELAFNHKVNSTFAILNRLPRTTNNRQFWSVVNNTNRATNDNTDNTGILNRLQGRPQDLGGEGAKNFFFRFGNLHVAKRHAAHGEAMRIARGVRGHASPRKFFKTMQFGAF